MLGLEIRDSLVTAVVVDELGQVLARAAVEPATDPGAAALKALDSVGDKAGGSVSLGVAAINPDSSSVAAVEKALAPKYGATFLRKGATASGTAAAVAEAWVGAAQKVGDSVYFSVADHATAGVVRNGAHIAGSHRRGTLVAWLALNPVEREDYRKIGCLEAEVAAAGIVRRLVWRVKAGDSSKVADDIGGNLSAVTVDRILEAARQQDGVAVSVVRETAKYLGMAAANLVAITDPEMLVLGGVMASAADLLLDLVNTELARRLPKTTMDALVIVPAVLGSDAAAIGAARLAANPPS
jgi:glucokinase